MSLGVVGVKHSQMSELKLKTNHRRRTLFSILFYHLVAIFMEFLLAVTDILCLLFHFLITDSSHKKMCRFFSVVFLLFFFLMMKINENKLREKIYMNDRMLRVCVKGMENVVLMGYVRLIKRMIMRQ